jgi:hypothetical protein
VPLPSSPTPSTTGSPVRLQAQPSHRVSPLMPFYPSLADDDDDDLQQPAPPLLSPPSHLQVDDIAFGRPTPRSSLISIQVPAAVPVPQPVASPSRTTPTDPRSPISRLTRIPGSIIGISRLVARARCSSGIHLGLYAVFFAGNFSLVVPRLRGMTRMGGNNWVKY